MATVLGDTLRAFESERRIRIIYAVEHGSKRWNLEGPNSDNDVGFIYVNPLSWYLKIGDHRDKQLESERDNIKVTVPGVGDFQGWDLRKTLNAMHKGDPMLSEWLHAPEAYLEEPRFTAELYDLFAHCWSPLKYYYRNVSTAKRNFEAYVRKDHHPDTKGSDIVKKWLHTLRPLLNALWIKQTCSVVLGDGIFPPADFTGLLYDLRLPTGIDNHIRLLVAAKRRGVGDETLTLPRTTLYEWMGSEIERLSSTAMPNVTQQPIDITRLDAYFARVATTVNRDFFEGK